MNAPWSGAICITAIPPICAVSSWTRRRTSSWRAPWAITYSWSSSLSGVNLPTSASGAAGARAPRRARSRRRRGRRRGPPSGSAKSSTSGSARRTAAATATGIQSSSSLGSERRSASRIRYQQASAPRAMPLPPAAIGIPSPNAESSPSAASIPSDPHPITSSSDATLPTRRSIAGQEDRDREPADEEVADVVVDERCREEPPPLVPDRSDDRAEVEDGEVGGPLDDERRSRRPRARGSSPPAASRDRPRSSRSTPASATRLRRSAALRRRRSRRSSRTWMSSPTRSSFGARFRSRVPQYGHSVTYGLTSEPQLLQTTDSSGPAIAPLSPTRRERRT